MSDLIDRQALLEWFKNWSDYDEFSVGYITGVIEDEPSADVDLSGFSDKLWRAAYERGKAEVARHGRWIDTETSYADGVQQKCQCSVCKRLSPRPLGDFCRWCGTDMRGDT